MKENNEYFLRIRAFYEEGFSVEDAVIGTPALQEDVETVYNHAKGTISETIRNVVLDRKGSKAKVYSNLKIKDKRIERTINDAVDHILGNGTKTAQNIYQSMALQIVSVDTYEEIEKNKYKAIVLFYICNYDYKHTAKLIKESRPFIYDMFYLLDKLEIKKHREETIIDYIYTKKYMESCKAVYSAFINNNGMEQVEYPMFEYANRSRCKKQLIKLRELYINSGKESPEEKNVVLNTTNAFVSKFEKLCLKERIREIGEIAHSKDVRYKAIINHLKCLTDTQYIHESGITPLEARKSIKAVRKSVLVKFKFQFRGLCILYLMSKKYNSAKIESILNCSVFTWRKSMRMLDEEYSMEEIIDAMPVFEESFGDLVEAFYV